MQRKYTDRNAEGNASNQNQQERCTDNKQTQHPSEPRGRLTKYVRSLKWSPIPISVGFALLAYQHYRRVIRRSSEANGSNGVQLARDWEVSGGLSKGQIIIPSYTEVVLTCE